MTRPVGFSAAAIHAGLDASWFVFCACAAALSCETGSEPVAHRADRHPAVDAATPARGARDADAQTDTGAAPVTSSEPLTDAGADAATCQTASDRVDLNGVLGDWRAQALSPSLSQEDSRDRPAIAVEPGGAVHLFAAGLYAHNKAGSWFTEQIPGDAERWLGTPGLAVAGAAVHVAFASELQLTHAVRVAGEWTSDVVHDAPAPAYALALDPSGVPHVAYWADGEFSVAAQRDGSWHRTVLDTGEPPRSGVARGVAAASSAQRVHLAYLLRFNENSCQVRHAIFDASAWTASTLEEGYDCSGSVALALSPDGNPWVAYVLDDMLRLMHYGDGGWTNRKLESAARLDFDLTVDRRDVVHGVAISNGVATYWTLPPAATQPDAVPGAVWDGFGGVAIARSADDLAHVAFVNFDFSNSAQLFYGSPRLVHPDGVDADCDGVDGVDTDRDGIASVWSGGSDCDDAVPDRPGDTGCGIAR